jgi:RNA polymerase sigma factor (sigma-70 family)
MASGRLPTVIQYLRRLGSSQASGGLSDAQLLDRFLTQRDEAACEVLVWRHAPLVWSVCRRVLRHEQDAEDAFQATFLTFVRKAGSLGKREAVGSWLYKVAYRVALEARARAVKRAAHEQQGVDWLSAEPSHDLLWRDVRPVLDEEVNQLPSKYRIPFVLCYLEGKTNQEAAQELGCPVGTILSRLAWARERLRQRLTRRGLTLSAGMLAALLASNGASASVSVVMVGSTVQAALLFGANQTMAAGVISAKVTALTEGVLRTMFLTKLKIATALLLAVGVIGTGAGIIGHPALAARPSQAKKDEPTKGAGEQKNENAKAERGSHESGVIKKVDPTRKKITIHSDGIWYEAALEVSTPVKYLTPIFVDNSLSFGTKEVERPLAPNAKVIIDGREGKLADLPPQTPVHLTLDAEGKVTRIEAAGTTLSCFVEAVDPARHAVAVSSEDGGIGTKERPKLYEVAQDAKVRIDGKESQFADLKAGMRVTVQVSAVKPAVLDIQAAGPTVPCLLKAVDAAQHTITIHLRKNHLTFAGLPVAKDAKVWINGKESQLADLQPGMRVQLQMGAETDCNLVVGIKADQNAKK